MRLAIAGASGQVGTLVTRSAVRAGHSIVPLSRRVGVDLTLPNIHEDLVSRLNGVDAVIDVTNLAARAGAPPSEFFPTVARNLGAAATYAGVPRTVLLSIIGVDRVPHETYYAYKHAHELFHAEASPVLHIVRSAPFHTYPAAMIDRGRRGAVTMVQDFPLQPVDVGAVAEVLLRTATVGGPPILEVAGPRRERLADLVRRVSVRRDDNLTVVPIPASAELATGAGLPGPDARLVGPGFTTWLDRAFGASS